MHSPRMLTFARYAIALSALLALCACSELQKLFPPQAKSAPAVKVRSVDAADYVTHLALANATLDHGGTFSEIASDMQAIQSYTQQKKTRPASLPLAVMEYTGKDGKAHKTMAPLSEQNNFSALKKIWSHLETSGSSLKEIRLVKASITSSSALPAKGKDEAATRQALSERKQVVLAAGAKLPALDEAKTYLTLLKFFTASQNRDGAYICADNAKRLLPAVYAGDKAAADQLAKDLSAAEIELREKMPY